MKLLIVEDEPRALERLRRSLTEEGHHLVTASEGNAGWDLAHSYEFDAIILDVILPRMNAFALAQKLHVERGATPVLILTAKDAVAQIVGGLGTKAEDYLIKPFGLCELLMRLRAFQRRSTSGTTSRLQVGDLILDLESHEVTRAGTAITLTHTEYNLLEGLMFRAGKVVTRRNLIEWVWGFDRDIEDNNLDAFVRLLRNKVDRKGSLKLILNVRGVGYMIRAEAVAEGAAG